MLDYTFTDEQEMFRESLRDFCAKKIAPAVKILEEQKEIPKDLLKELADFELLAMTVPEKYGGINASAVTAGIAAEELGKADPTCSIPVVFLVEASWGYLLSKYGTEEAKSEILPKVTKGENFLGIATTESEAGSDLASMRTKITKTEKGYLVNGEKNYISGVREAIKWGGGHVTLAKQMPELGTRGMTMFYLPLSSKGITPSYFEDLGREAISCGGFNIENVEIPSHYLIGEENKGFYIVHEGYELARGLIALVCIGAATKALENGIKYIKERKAFGKPIAKYEGIQFLLAEHYSKIQAVRELAYKALWLFDREREGKAKRFEVSKAIAMAKMLSPKWAFDAINDVMQWQGAFGYTKECPDQTALRGVRSFTLAEGSTEIMKIIVARELLGKEFLPYR
ncbi:MAG: acyl-CoA dehydrogenase family protein [Candidatus Thermoplasmatota archaeon]|nr:acyl-CoA dehydrogenase family protein [Candidatus Thermoplasmatota archaeon]